MAENRYRGDAQAFAQIYNAVFAAAGAGGITYYIQRNGKQISFVTTAATTAADLVTLMVSTFSANASAIPEFTEMSVAADPTNAANMIVTGQTAGNPFTLTSSANITLTVVQAATGPEDLSNPSNWSLGAIPVNTNDITFPPDQIRKVRFGLTALAAVAAGVVKMPIGTYGLPDWNDLGYQEDRATTLQLLSATRIEIGSAVNSPDYVRMKVTQGNAVIKIMGGQVGGVSSLPAIILSSGNTATHKVECISGTIGLGFDADLFYCSTCTFGTRSVSGLAGSLDTSPTVYIGTGFVCSGRLAVYDGTIYSRAASIAADVYGGQLFSQTGNVTGIVVWSGSFRWDSNGSLGTAGSGTGGGGAGAVEARDSGIIDLSGTAVAYTLLADCVRATDGGKFVDPHKRAGATYTLVTDMTSLPLCVAGNTFNLAIT